MAEIKFRSSKKSACAAEDRLVVNDLASIVHAVNNLFCCIRLHADAMRCEPRSQKAGQDLFNTSRELERQVKKLVVLIANTDLDKAPGSNQISETKAKFPQRKGVAE